MVDLEGDGPHHSTREHPSKRETMRGDRCRRELEGLPAVPRGQLLILLRKRDRRACQAPSV
jgi:hypothetical protein